MHIYTDIKYMINPFGHIWSSPSFLQELKAYVQVYKPSVILEQAVHTNAQNQIY